MGSSSLLLLLLSSGRSSLGFGFTTLLAFLLLLLLFSGSAGGSSWLLLLGLLGIVVWLSRVLTESDGAEDSHERSHLQNQVSVSGKVLKLTVARLLVKNFLEATSQS